MALFKGNKNYHLLRCVQIHMKAKHFKVEKKFLRVKSAYVRALGLHFHIQTIA